MPKMDRDVPEITSEVGKSLRDAYLGLCDAQDGLERAVKRADDPNMIRWLYEHLDAFRHGMMHHMMTTIAIDTMIRRGMPFPDAEEMGRKKEPGDIPAVFREAFEEDA